MGQQAILMFSATFEFPIGTNNFGFLELFLISYIGNQKWSRSLLSAFGCIYFEKYRLLSGELLDLVISQSRKKFDLADSDGTEVSAGCRGDSSRNFSSRGLGGNESRKA